MVMETAINWISALIFLEHGSQNAVRSRGAVKDNNGGKDVTDQCKMFGETVRKNKFGDTDPNGSGRHE